MTQSTLKERALRGAGGTRQKLSVVEGASAGPLGVRGDPESATWPGDSLQSHRCERDDSFVEDGALEKH